MVYKFKIGDRVKVRPDSVNSNKIDKIVFRSYNTTKRSNFYVLESNYKAKYDGYIGNHGYPYFEYELELAQKRPSLKKILG